MFKEFSEMTLSLTPFQKILTPWRFVICLETVDINITRCQQSDSREHTELLSFQSPTITSIC